ncbi:hypothetical protein VNO78_04679 [Psophocarpus tetragonolobus]|uniref:Uncharacterized protein n=1 Tax=Psophocarpus tetragonolobus TaxID=3891 RepID=A0AAN9XXU5_PSOTE
MAPPQEDLKKIGVEGFALIDQFWGTRRRRSDCEVFDSKDIFNGSTRRPPKNPFPARRPGSWVVVDQVPPADVQPTSPSHPLKTTKASMSAGNASINCTWKKMKNRSRCMLRAVYTPQLLGKKKVCRPTNLIQNS